MNGLRKVSYVFSALTAFPILFSTSVANAGAIYTNSVAAELTYSVTSGDINDLDIFGDTLVFVGDAFTSGVANASADGSMDAPLFTSPLVANVSGETFSSDNGYSFTDWSVDAFLAFQNIGAADVTLQFDFSWYYTESTSLDDPLFDAVDVSSFIFLSEFTDDAGLVDLFEVDTLADVGLPSADSGSFSFTRNIEVDAFYSLEASITADGEAESFERTVTPVVSEPGTFFLAFLGLTAGWLGRKSVGTVERT